MNDIEIILNDKKTIKVPYKTTLMEIVLNNPDVCEDKIIGAKIQNEIFNLKYEVVKDTNIKLFDINDIDGYKITQAGLKFILEIALKENFNRDIEVIFDHSIGNGIHTTIVNHPNFNKEDTNKLKECMDNLIKEDLPITKIFVSSKEAVNYYHKLKLNEKADNTHNLSGRLVAFYKLKNHINYFFSEMPYSTGFLGDFELVYINDNELAIVLPTNHTFNLVEYKKYNKIIECFKENTRLLNKYKMPFIKDINHKISQGYAKELLRLFETNFDNELYNIAKTIYSKNIKYVLLSGPSSSGKTTTSKKLALHLQTLGYNPLLISTDDYFVSRENTPKKSDGTYDFESIKCVDIPKFNQDLKDLVDGKSVSLPSYNFKTGQREYNSDPIKLDKESIILIEGIHCLNDNLTPDLESNLKYKIYLSPFMGVRIDRHNYISTTDLRLIRRIIRDNNNRGTSVFKTLEQWKNVRLGEEENIFPYVDNADVIFNTALPYELGVLKVYAEPLLYSVNSTSPYLEESKRLIKIFDSIYPIPSEYVEEDSILREFIGGSAFKREGDK